MPVLANYVAVVYLTCPQLLFLEEHLELFRTIAGHFITVQVFREYVGYFIRLLAYPFTSPKMTFIYRTIL